MVATPQSSDIIKIGNSQGIRIPIIPILFKRLIGKNPQLRIAIAKTLQQLENNCYHHSLRTHKLL